MDKLSFAMDKTGIDKGGGKCYNRGTQKQITRFIQRGNPFGCRGNKTAIVKGKVRRKRFFGDKEIAVRIRSNSHYRISQYICDKSECLSERDGQKP